MRTISEKYRVLSMQFMITLCVLNLFISISRAEITLTVEDGAGLPGSSGHQVVVRMENVSDKVKGLQMDICDKDNYISCTGCEVTERTADFSCSQEEQLDSGCCRVLLFSFGSDLIGKGTGSIFTLTNDVSEEAPAGECRDLNPVEIGISDESGVPFPSSEVVIEPGEFCFFTSSTTTTTIPSITIVSDPPWRSHLILLPSLMVIEGQGTHFKCCESTTLSFEPPQAVVPSPPLILSELYIWDLIWVTPSWWAGEGDQKVTVTVSSEDEVVSEDFEIKVFPGILDQK